MTKIRFIAIILLIALCISSLISCELTDSLLTSNKTVAWCGDIEINEGMMTFFINDYIREWYEQYYIYVTYGLISFNISEDMREQVMTAQDASYMGVTEFAGKTWHEYFTATVLENVELYLIFANAGNDIEACQLDKDDRAEIDNKINTLKNDLKISNLSVSDQYGKDVNEDTVRSCYELMYKAEKFQEYNNTRLKEVLMADDSSVKAYPSKHGEDFYSAAVINYTIKVSERAEGSALRYDSAVENAKRAASKIASAQTPSEFVKLIEMYKKTPSSFIENDSNTWGEESASDQISEEELIEKYSEEINYQTEDEIGKWIFEENAETNEILISDEIGTEIIKGSAQEGNGNLVFDKYSVTVSMLTEQPALDSSLTHNIAYLIADDKGAAQRFLNEFTSSDKKDRESFINIAEQIYETSYSQKTEDDAIFVFDSVDGAKEKYFALDYDVLNQWVDDLSRKDGDYSDEVYCIQPNSRIDGTGNNKTYYAVLFFDGHAEEAWYVDAFGAVLQESIDEWYDDEIRKQTVKFDYEAIDNLDTVLR